MRFMQRNLDSNQIATVANGSFASLGKLSTM
jgi:hypothetical protein